MDGDAAAAGVVVVESAVDGADGVDDAVVDGVAGDEAVEEEGGEVAAAGLSSLLPAGMVLFAAGPDAAAGAAAPAAPAAAAPFLPGMKLGSAHGFFLSGCHTAASACCR